MVMAVKAGWVVLCSRVSTILATIVVEENNELLSLYCLFAIQPDSRLHLPRLVSVRSDWGFRGEDALPLLGCRRSCESSWAALSSPATVVATSGGVRKCKLLRLQSSHNPPHKCQFLQIMAPCRVWMTLPVRMEHEFSPYRRDRAGSCASQRTRTPPPCGKGFFFGSCGGAITSAAAAAVFGH